MSKKIAGFGSISSGTMRKEDLIPDFVWELHHIFKHRSKKLSIIEYRLKMAEKFENKNDTPDEYWNNELSDWDLEFLFDMLDEYSPAYGYFGANTGDGSDYGFWLSESFEYDFEGLKIEDLSEVNKDYFGEILHINDHGNMTLYNKGKNGRFYEIWSLV